MSVTPASFRQCLPAFSNGVAFSDEAITFWLGVAQMMLPPERWGLSSPDADVPPKTRIDLGTIYYIAHQLVLEDQANKAASKGATPGMQKGAISGDSVNNVSRSYDVSAGLELDAGHWGQTTYGNRFHALAQMVGMGPVTVGGGGGRGLLDGPAWPGPPPAPGWFG